MNKHDLDDFNDRMLSGRLLIPSENIEESKEEEVCYFDIEESTGICLEGSWAQFIYDR